MIITPPVDPWWQIALDTVLPPLCVGCGRRGAEVCEQCLGEIEPLGPACPSCSAPSRFGSVCEDCLRHKPILRAILAGHAHNGTLRAAVLAFKYRARTRLHHFLSTMLATALEHRPLTIDVVIPVPLSERRTRERGFNQAELLARPLAQAASWRLDADSLKRTRHTEQQALLPGDQRQANVAGAFEVTSPDQIEGKRVLLVDDVCTTGATLEACAVPLLAAGAEGVWGVVVTRG